jgi:hypothetical protein
MKTKNLFSIALFFLFFSGFSQQRNVNCVNPFETYRLSRELQLQRPGLKASSQLLIDKNPVCESLPAKTVVYKPLVYDWAKAAQRIEDYRNFQYEGSRLQDVNGRDLVLNVITDEMLNSLLHRAFPN